MPRSFEGVLPDLTKDIEGMEVDEMTATDLQRIELALRAAGVSRSLRDHPWATEAEQRDAFALADRAARVSNLCISQSRPGGRA